MGREAIGRKRRTVSLSTRSGGDGGIAIWASSQARRPSNAVALEILVGGVSDESAQQADRLPSFSPESRPEVGLAVRQVVIRGF